ncbi:MAG TPA: acyltransferase [Armatimonadota bacterium]|jgi:peptidoglycan/LPS O-acetylase OafA/YrhL
MLRRFWNWIWPASQIKGRILALDVLRGLAILMVLAAHVSPYWLPARESALGFPLHWLRDNGPRGVDLFFVLSGFLVGGLLVREARQYGRVDWKRFLLRRGFKIWPAYCIYLLVLPALIYVQHGSVFPFLWGAKANLFHLQNYWREGTEFLAGRGTYITPRPHTWSLAVEEHFYLGLTLLMVLLTRGRQGRPGNLRLILPLGVAIMAISFLSRLQLWNAHPGISGNYFRYPTHFRMDGLFFGVMMAYVYHAHRAWFFTIFRYWPATLAAAGVLLLVFPQPQPLSETAFTWTYGPTVTYLGFALLLGSFIVGGETSPFLQRLLHRWVFRAMAFLGFFSYSIYLWHWDLGLGAIKVITRYGGWAGSLAGSEVRLLLFAIPAVTLYVVFATGMGILLGRLIETPALILRDRILPRRAASMEVASDQSDATVLRGAR